MQIAKSKLLLLSLFLFISICGVFPNLSVAQGYEGGPDRDIYVRLENGDLQRWIFDKIIGEYVLTETYHGPGDGGDDDGDHYVDGNEESDGDGYSDEEDPWENEEYWNNWWQDPWEDWFWSDEEGWIDNSEVGEGGPTLTCPAISGRTVKGPNRSRSTIAIGEEVEVRIANSCGAIIVWSIEGPGILTTYPSNNNQCLFQAEWTKGKIKIKATLTNLGSCSSCPNVLTLEYDVILPQSMYFERIPPKASCTSNIHVKNKPSAGYWADIYIEPDNVNFYNVRFNEDAAVPITGGDYFNITPPFVIPNHSNQGIDLATSIVITGKGTLLVNSDAIYVDFVCNNVRSASLPGRIVWNIPQYYIDELNGTAHAFDITAQQGENYGGTDSVFETSKISNLGGSPGSSFSFKLTDPTSNCLFFTDPGCP